ncbi:MAG: S46 family peptidase [Nannocystaceae bacterium]|nr:S46 family peptidase [bacterium]
MRRPSALVALALTCLAPATTLADEGQWMPKQIGELDASKLAQMGLELEPSQIWNEKDGGLMKAIVNLSGCSAGFVSSRGLVATNHHCAYGAIQANSTVEHDYLTDGFVAQTLTDELPAKGRTVKVLESITDVSAEVRAAADAATDPVARAKAVEDAIKTLVDACEVADEGHSCTVRSFYSGSEFQLFDYLEYRDVRLVFAPPSMVGNYGGEVDNWMWPRHSGDFTLLRVYAGPDGKPAEYAEANEPLEPQRWLEVSPEGVSEGDFVSVMGYPGHTDRYLPLPEVERQLEQALPAKVDLYGQWIDLLQEKGDADPAVKIKVAASLRRLANVHKNSRGMIDGIRRLGLFDRRKREDAELAAWAKTADAKYGNVLPDLAALAKERRDGFGRDFATANVTRSGNAVAIAIDLVRRAKEHTKPDLERVGKYRDRGESKLRSAMERRLRDYDPGVDEGLLRVFVRWMAALPEDQRITDLDEAGVATLLSSTKVTDPDFVEEAFDAADWDALQASTDPLIVWARDIVEEIEAYELRKKDRRGRELVLGPLYFDMAKAVREGPVYPDANGTLRFSYATVRGYSPQEGLIATPHTTVSGQVAKHTGVDPFDLPEPVRDAAPEAGGTYWADPALGDVPVCFLASGDTTGGNSGSPVVDGKGRWVGLNFDRVWENIAGDFGYAIDRSRNVIVDIRYILWLIDDVYGAKGLIDELGLREQADAGPRDTPAQATPAKPGTPAATAVGEDEAEGETGPDPEKLGCRAGGEPSALALLLLGLLGLRRRS